MCVCACACAFAYMRVFVWVVVAYYRVCMCEWYIAHVYMKVALAARCFYRMLIVRVSYFAILLL